MHLEEMKLVIEKLVIEKGFYNNPEDAAKKLLFAFIELYPPDHRSIDVDNRNKPILDSLKYRPKDKAQTLDSWIFADDDSQVKCLLTVLLNVVPGGKVVITLKQINLHEFCQKIRILLSDDCPGPDGNTELWDFAYTQRTLFDG